MNWKTKFKYYISGENIDKVWLAVFSVLAGILNYAFQIIISRGLSVAEFGDFNAITSFVSNALNIYLPLCVIGCRITAEQSGRIRDNKKPMRQLLAIVTVISLLVIIISVIFYLIYGKTVWTLPHVLFVVVLLITTAYYNFAYYMVQGMQLFFWYGLGSFMLTALKIFLGTVSINNGGGIDGVVIAMTLCNLVLIVLGISIIWKKGRREHSADNPVMSKRALLDVYSITFVAQILFSLYINNGEILLMKMFYDKKEIGIYSSAAILGKASLYLHTILATIILPNIAEIKDDHEQVRKKSKQMMGICLGVSLIYALFFVLFGNIVIQLLFGAEYVGAKKYVVCLALLVFPININTIIYNFLLALNRLKAFSISMLSLMTGVVLIVACKRPPMNIVVLFWAMAMSINALVGWLEIKKTGIYGKKE